MAFKLQSANGRNKQYLRVVAGQGMRGSQQWEYVTTDTPATVDGSGYITAATGADHRLALDMLSVGDLIWVFQVAAIDDERTIEADKAAGIVDISLHAVLVNTGEVIDLSDDLLGATVTYGD